MSYSSIGQKIQFVIFNGLGIWDGSLPSLLFLQPDLHKIRAWIKRVKAQPGFISMGQPSMEHS